MTWIIDKGFAKTLENEVGINVWNEFMNVLKSEIIAQPQKVKAE